MSSLLLALTLSAPTAAPQPASPVPIGPPLLLVPLPPGPASPFAQPSPTPLWDHFAHRPSWCPAPAAQPFQMTPRVCVVGPCPCGDGGHEDETKKGPLPWVKEFNQAAHFPYPRYADNGSPVPLDGLLIYEGMKLTVHPDTGIYDVSFTATVPDMPVTVRMQLVFERFPNDPGAVRLTLPPFRLEPRRDARPGDPAAFTFNVAHRGFSSLFVQPPLVVPVPAGPGPRIHLPTAIGPPVPPPTVIGPAWILSRLGTARFGTVTAVDEPTR